MLLNQAYQQENKFYLSKFLMLVCEYKRRFEVFNTTVYGKML